MALTLSVIGRLLASVEDLQQPAAVDLGQNFIFTQRADLECVYPGVVTDDVVNLGSLATGGAKLVLVKVTQGSATIKFTVGATTETIAWPLVPGAYFLYCNPSGGFPTSAKVTTTAAATVKFLAVG